MIANLDYVEGHSDISRGLGNLKRFSWLPRLRFIFVLLVFIVIYFYQMSIK